MLKAALLCAAGAVMYWREPVFFAEPRFWAEEGSRYFAYAFSHPWYQTLVTPHLGYFSLFNNMASIMALHLVHISNAPLVTTCLAFMIQLVPLAMIVWSDAALWDSTLKKVIGILIVLFTPLSGEVWLNTINSQFYFSLITFLILVDPVPNKHGYKKWVYRFLLLLAGLTGVMACFLTPLFLLRAWAERRGEQVIHASILSLCTALQIVVLIVSFRSETSVADRFVVVELPVMTSIIWVKTIVLPLFNVHAAETFSSWLLMIRDKGGQEYRMLELLLLFATLVFFGFLLWSGVYKKQFMIVGSYALITFLTIISSLGEKAALIHATIGARYFYVPSVILMILIFSNIHRSKQVLVMIRSGLCVTLLVVSLALGMLHYKSTVIASKSWPKWREEVARWQADPEHKLRIWPDGWTMTLRGP